MQGVLDGRPLNDRYGLTQGRLRPLYGLLFNGIVNRPDGILHPTLICPITAPIDQALSMPL